MVESTRLHNLRQGEFFSALLIFLFHPKEGIPVVKSGVLRWAIRIALAALTVAGLIFFARELVAVSSTGGIARPSSISWGWLGLSIVLGLVQYMYVARLFSWLVGVRPGWRVEAVFLTSQLAKYVPGRVWSLLAQKALLGSDARFMGVLGANLVIASILLASQLAAVAGALGYLRHGIMAGVGVALAVCASAGAFAVLLSKASSKLEWRVLVGWSRPGIGGATLMGSAVSVLVTSGAWISLFHGALGYSFDEAIALQGVSSASSIAGMFSILPAGLGLREGAFVVLGRQEWPLPHADMMSLALMSRAWLLLVDACVIVIGLMGARLWNRSSEL